MRIPAILAATLSLALAGSVMAADHANEFAISQNIRYPDDSNIVGGIVSLVDPVCSSDSNRRKIKFVVDYLSLTTARSEKSSWDVASAVQKLSDYGWPGKYFCPLISDGFSGEYETRFKGEVVGHGRFRGSHWGIEDIVWKPVANPPENSETGKLLDRLYSYEFSVPDPQYGSPDRTSFEIGKVAPFVLSIIEQAEPDEKPQLYYMLARFHRYKFEPDEEQKAYIEANRLEDDYAGPDGEKYLRMASELGHPIATVRLARSLGQYHLTEQAFFRASEGQSPIITEDVRDRFEAVASLIDLGMAQRSAYMHSLNRALVTQAGIDVRSGGLGPRDTPGIYAVEFALNERLREAAGPVGLAISPAVRLDPGMISSCDEDWCYVAGIGKMRFSVKTPPQCGSPSGNQVECDYSTLLVIDSTINLNFSGYYDLLNMHNVAGGLRCRGTFERDGDRWHLTSGVACR